MNSAILISIAARLASSLLVPSGAPEEAPIPGAHGSLPTPVVAGSVAADSPAQGDGTSTLGRSPSPLSEAELDRYRGGQTTVASLQNVSAVAQDNVITGDYVAGAVTLSNSALSNFTGVGNIAINTGAQVNLQSVMNLTINVSP